MAKYIDCYAHQQAIKEDIARRRQMRIKQVRQQERDLAARGRAEYHTQQALAQQAKRLELEVYHHVIYISKKYLINQ
jgi:hypothetical protein